MSRGTRRFTITCHRIIDNTFPAFFSSFFTLPPSIQNGVFSRTASWWIPCHLQGQKTYLAFVCVCVRCSSCGPLCDRRSLHLRIRLADGGSFLSRRHVFLLESRSIPFKAFTPANSPTLSSNYQNSNCNQTRQRRMSRLFFVPGNLFCGG